MGKQVYLTNEETEYLEMLMAMIMANPQDNENDDNIVMNIYSKVKNIK